MVQFVFRGFANGFLMFFLNGNITAKDLNIIVGVTVAALFSVWRGIDGGVKLFSNINMVIALAVMVALHLLTGPEALGLNVLHTVLGTLLTYIPLAAIVAVCCKDGSIGGSCWESVGAFQPGPPRRPRGGETRTGSADALRSEPRHRACGLRGRG